MRRIFQAALVAAGLLAGVAALAGGAEPVWREDATRLYRDNTLHLPWANSLGDWVDADGKPMGAKPFATANAPKVNGPTVVDIDVTQLVRAHGADFRINSVGGIVKLASRKAPDGGPELLVTRGGETRTLKASADTTMDITTFNSLGAQPILLTRYGVLVRFDQPADQTITRAALRLTALHTYGRVPRLVVFRPVVLSAPTQVATGATFEPDRPERLRTNPAFLAKMKPGAPEAPRGGAVRVLLSVSGAQLKARPSSRIVGDTMEAWFERDILTAVSDLIVLPGAPTEAYLTVILKLGNDWTAPGGKLPGLSNTGQIHPADTCLIHGLPAKPGGWGGRGANGCHWSARTVFRGVRDGSVGSGTYFYALSPSDTNGVVDFWSQALPKGRWVAYVERVKLNDPGRANGEIAYWLIDRATAPDGKRVQAAGGIIWRDSDVPQSAINELWADVYCGGRDCGAAPWPRSTLALKRLTVTNALPDLTAVQAELDRLNRAG